jgi:hypothetical protein
MKIFKTTKMPESYELILFGDEQRGNLAFSRDGLNQCLSYILDKPNRFAIHMGDSCDSFYIDDKRYDPYTVKDTPIKQVTEFINDMTPLVKENRLLTCLIGNHEYALLKKAGDITAYACDELAKIGSDVFFGYGTYSSKIEFYDSKGLQFKTFVTHGRKGINSVSPDPVRKKAQMLFTLKRHLENMFGDTLLMAKAHAHKVLVLKPEPTLYLTTENGKIKQHYTKAGISTRDLYIPPENRFYACTGSFLKTMIEGVSTYSEMSEYPPVEIGYVKAIVENRELVDVQEVKIQ